eukprot:m.80562 g.80562  ORF g.80562 m.80562 type:complete len:162 (-) comp19388_c0_seq2:41-526(-)
MIMVPLAEFKKLRETHVLSYSQCRNLMRVLKDARAREHELVLLESVFQTQLLMSADDKAELERGKELQEKMKSLTSTTDLMVKRNELTAAERDAAVVRLTQRHGEAATAAEAADLAPPRRKRLCRDAYKLRDVLERVRAVDPAGSPVGGAGDAEPWFVEDA